jgi:hypothetical protein
MNHPCLTDGPAATKRTSRRQRCWTRHFVKTSTKSRPAYDEKLNTTAHGATRSDGMRVHYKKAPDLAAREVASCDQTRGRRSQAWEEAKPNRISNIQAKFRQSWRRAAERALTQQFRSAVVNLINHVFDFHVRDQEQWLCVFVLQQ